MKLTKNTKGFTLIELIVVITILAILGTVAFVSLQGYSGEARNSKRTSDIAQIARKIEVLSSANGYSTLDFVVTTNSNPVDGGSEAFLAGANLTASGVYTASTGAVTISGSPFNYKAGKIDFSVLGEKQTDFQDPKSSQDYLIGSTSLVGGAYEVAATIEQDGGSAAAVNGTYNPRVQSEGGTVKTAISLIGNAETNVQVSKINYFKKGDTLTLGTATPTTVYVTYVSKDGQTVRMKKTTAGDVSLANTTTVRLASGNEIAGLIESTTANTPVSDGSSNVPYSVN